MSTIDHEALVDEANRTGTARSASVVVAPITVDGRPVRHFNEILSAARPSAGDRPPDTPRGGAGQNAEGAG